MKLVCDNSYGDGWSLNFDGCFRVYVCRKNRYDENRYFQL